MQLLVSDTWKNKEKKLKLNRTYSFEYLIEDIKSNIILVAVIMFLSIIAVLGLGIYQYNNAGALTPEQKEEIDDYDEKLANYEDYVVQADTALTLAIEQRDAVQEYIDNSIYMKIDSQNIQVATAQFAINTAGNLGNIQNAIMVFVNDGGLKKSLGEVDTELNVEYWRDIVAISNNGNMLNVTVMHYDMDVAKGIRDIVVERINGEHDRIASIHGEYECILSDTSEYVKADVNVTNAQNSIKTNLKGLINSVGDQESRLNGGNISLQKFIEDNEPRPVTVVKKGLPKTLAIFTVLGIVVGIVLNILILYVKATMSSKVMSYRDLERAGLIVWNVCNVVKNKNLVEISKSAQELPLALRDTDTVVFYSLVNDEKIEKIVKAYIENAVGIRYATHIENAEKSAFPILSKSKNVLTFVKYNKTTYAEIEKCIDTYSKYGIHNIGFVIVK